MKFDISNMLNADVYDHPVEKIELIETHISWVVLTGQYAYKIKKPVNFGFLDFSTLQKRHTFCEQEIRLNRRLTTGIYLDVVAISLQQNQLRIGADAAIEYAIKMTQFPQVDQLDNLLEVGRLTLEHMDAIGHMVADFHQRTQVAGNSVHYGSPNSLYQPVAENFTQIKRSLHITEYDRTLTELQRWSEAEFKKLRVVFTLRKQRGFIRECHGDMHLRNLLWLGDKSHIEPGKGPMAFDCIEFNAQLRWIDVISEIAFLVMDLHDRKQAHLANRFLNTYLEVTGDYAGLVVISFYLSYRAMVRAKVDVLRLGQPGIATEEKLPIVDEFKSYVELAKVYSQPSKPKLIIMRGVSASGKSTLSQQIVDKLGAIRIRSDVERKRLVNPEKTSSKINSGIYTEKVSEQTYSKLLELASQVITAGYSVVIDAAFLQQQQRAEFQELSVKLDIPYCIVQVTAPADILRQRIIQRKNDVSDADLNVLEYQLANWQPLLNDELDKAITVNSLETKEVNSMIKKITQLT